MDSQTDGSDPQQNLVTYIGWRAHGHPKVEPLLEYLRSLNPLDERLLLVDASAKEFRMFQWFSFARRTNITAPEAWLNGYVDWIEGRRQVD